MKVFCRCDYLESLDLIKRKLSSLKSVDLIQSVEGLKDKNWVFTKKKKICLKTVNRNLAWASCLLACPINLEAPKTAWANWLNQTLSLYPTLLPSLSLSLCFFLSESHFLVIYPTHRHKHVNISLKTAMIPICHLMNFERGFASFHAYYLLLYEVFKKNLTRVS